MTPSPKRSGASFRSANPPADARALARELATEWSLAERLAPFEGHRWLADWDRQPIPTVHLDDFSGIPFLDGVSGVAEYQHRARLRSRTGDAFVATTPPAAGAEEYFRDRLGLGSPRGLVVEPSSGPLAVSAACLEPEILDRLISIASAGDRLAVHPFMGIEVVWDLAAALARRSGKQVRVLAPPPPVTWVANDKSLFEQVVTRALGPQWVVEGSSGNDAEEICRELVSLAGRHPTVALKRLRCASAMGNRVYESRSLLDLPTALQVETVERFLEDTLWDKEEGVLAVAWEETELSPSTQWWIPPAGTAPPRLDGIYEQILAGATKVFIGSRPSRLPAPVNEALAQASATIASVLQELGYVGRCSFDHLVIGDPDAEPELRFTECNGRWGGTSTPMHLVDRAFGSGRNGVERPCYRAQDVVLAELVGVPFEEVLRRVGDEVFDSATAQGRYLFYNLGPLREHGKLDAIAIARDSAEADWALDVHLPELLSRSA